MDLDGFEPKRIGHPLGEIRPRSSVKTDLERAQEECSEAIKQLASDISGIGPKAAERYLLRFEFGFGTEELTEQFDITPSTLSKQTNQVHRTILDYPTLARVVGQFRSDRAGLENPEASDQTLWEGNLELQTQTIYVAIDFHEGGATTPYSWKVSLRADSEVNDKTHRLRCDYLVDDEYGVLLKRNLKGVSYTHWAGKSRYEQMRTCEVYPLPHPDIPTADGTLLSALEYHTSYDIKASFLRSDWDSIEQRIKLAESGDLLTRSFAEHSLPETTTDAQGNREQVLNYTREVSRRDNLEHILRVYPLTRIENIPLETIDLLWNGSISTDDDYLSEITRTTQPVHKAGHRSIWDLSS